MIIGFVQREPALDQGLDHGDVGGEIGAVLAQVDRRAPRRGGPVDEGEILALETAKRRIGPGREARSQAAMLHLETAHPEVARTQEQLERAVLELGRALVIGGLDLLGVELEESIGVLRVALTGREQQAAVLGHRLEQRLHGLETERHSVAHQLGIVVTGEHVAAFRDAVGDAVHGHPLERAASGAHREGGEQEHPWGSWTHRGQAKDQPTKGQPGRSASSRVSPASNAGNRIAAGPRSPSTRLLYGVVSGFTSITGTWAESATSPSPAAGHTIAEVPTSSSTSERVTRSAARSSAPTGSDSPNHTTPGRSHAPQAQRGGSSGSGTVRSMRSAPQRLQRNVQRLPCSSIRLRLPAA